MRRNPVGSSGSRYGCLAPIRNAAPSGPTRHTSVQRIRGRNVQSTIGIREGCSQKGSITGSIVSVPRYMPHASADTIRNTSDRIPSSDPLPYRNSFKYGVSVAVASAIATVTMLVQRANDDNVCRRVCIAAESVGAGRRGYPVSMGASMSEMVCYKYSWVNRELS